MRLVQTGRCARPEPVEFELSPLRHFRQSPRSRLKPVKGRAAWAQEGLGWTRAK